MDNQKNEIILSIEALADQLGGTFAEEFEAMLKEKNLDKESLTLEQFRSLVACYAREVFLKNDPC